MHRARWPFLVAGGVVVAGIGAWVLAWALLSPIFATRLRAALEQRTEGTLVLGSLSYLPPYWIRASDVVLSSGGASDAVEWIQVDSVRIDLGRIPWAGAIEVDEIVLSGPTLRVERDVDGVHSAVDLITGGDSEQGGGAPPLGRLVIEDGTIEYVDRVGTSSESPTPIRVSEIGLRLGRPAGGGDGYRFEIEGGSPSLVSVSGHGTVGGSQVEVLGMAIDAQLPLRAGERSPGSLVVGVQEASGTIAIDERTWRLERASVHLVRSGGEAQGGSSPELLPVLSTIDLDLDVSGEGSFAGGEAASGYRLEGSASGGSIVPAGLALENVRGQAVLAPGSFEVSDLRAQTLGGSVAGGFSVPRGDGDWSASVEADGLELNQVAQRFGAAQPGARIAGRLSGRGSFSGSMRGAFLDSLRGKGAVQARGHDFYEIPIAGELLEAADLGGTVTLRNAAARFHVGGRKVALDGAALSSPAVGMQGQGDVGFDGSVDLDFVVVPLGDWKSKLEGSGVSVVKGPIAALAGTIQEIFGSASGLVYQFEVTGTLDDPQVRPVPAPVLTRTAATVFGHMVTDGWDTGLLDALGGEPSGPPPGVSPPSPVSRDGGRSPRGARG